MPLYDYICPSNGETLEVEHGWSERVRTWGELCVRAGRPRGATPPEAVVERLVGMPRIVRTRPEEEPAAESADGGEAAPLAPQPQGMHPIGCPCCPPPLDPGVIAFHRKLREEEKRRSGERS